MAGNEAFAGADDQLLSQMVGLSTVPDEQALLMDVLRQAQALRAQSQNGAEGRKTPWGGILGGIGGLINQGRGIMDEKKARAGLDANLGKARDGRMASARFQADALRGLMGGGSPGAQTPGMGPGMMGPPGGGVPQMPGAPQGMPMGGPPGGMPPEIVSMGPPDLLKREEDPTAFLQGLMPGYPGGW